MFDDKLIGILLRLPFVIDAAAGWDLSMAEDTDEPQLHVRDCRGLQNDCVISNWATMYLNFRRGKLARPTLRDDRPVFDNSKDLLHRLVFHGCSPESHW